MNKMSALSLWSIIVLVHLLIQLINGQSDPLPPRLHIAGAIATPHRSPVIKIRRPNILRSPNNVTPILTSRSPEELKPVTELAEEDQPIAFLPQLLREQQLAQAQQIQFQQTAAAFLNNDHPSHEASTTRLHHNEELQARPIYSEPTRLPERSQSAFASSIRPTFNDFGIGNFESSQRFGPERTKITKTYLPSADSNNVDSPQRATVIRNRPTPRAINERPRPKPILQARLVEQNPLQENRDSEHRRQRPIAQTIRKWREENHDGSITWGYENDDGSFKEEIIGTDCITKGTYGYIDPDGNKREYHYETGIKCDPNKRDNNDELQENGFINYEENKAVLPNGIQIDMTQLGKKKSKRPNITFRN